MQCAGDRPPQHDQRESTSGSESIHETSASDVQRRIGQQERRLQIRELLIGNRNVVLNRSNSDGQGLTIEIADRNRGCYECDGIPAILALQAEFDFSCTGQEIHAILGLTTSGAAMRLPDSDLGKKA